MLSGISVSFRVTARDSVFRIPEVDLGVPLTWAAVPRLLDGIGAARTRELILLGGDIDGDRALAWGMVHRSVAPDALDAAVEDIVGSVLRKPHHHCPRCRTVNRPQARYCAQCGARLNTP